MIRIIHPHSFRNSNRREVYAMDDFEIFQSCLFRIIGKIPGIIGAVPIRGLLLESGSYLKLYS